MISGAGPFLLFLSSYRRADAEHAEDGGGYCCDYLEDYRYCVLAFSAHVFIFLVFSKAIGPIGLIGPICLIRPI